MKTLADLAEPAAIHKRLLEVDVQKQCVDWARKHGYWARKFSSIAQRSVPDYLFAGEVYCMPEYKIKFACEFKAPGKTSTEAQIEEQQLMRLAGWYVFECDNFEKFKTVVIAYEMEQTA